MAFASTTNPLYVVRSEALPIIVQAMDRFPNYTRLLQEGCECFRNVAQMPDGAEVILELGALECVMRSMQVNFEADWVQQEGLGLVCRMVTESDEARDKVLKADGLRIIMDCMQAYPRSSWVALWGLEALERFAELDPKRVQNVNGFAFVSELTMTKAFLTAEAVQKTAKRVLRHRVRDLFEADDD
eukprot:TRINITY_DN73010_c0_g1_i1.p1 TRINITY_DN73010_c0_g1~~TRINITY_DN73010_c0_g1_i1.p1  ORF type:complete len:204 (-),score=38.90 TRINITY_DN73010_c0_g1_i1:67-624(-)